MNQYLWVIAVVIAAAFQCGRIALQRQIAILCGDMVSTAARYVLSIPLVIACAMGLGGLSLPTPGPVFFLHAGLAGMCQILASLLLLRGFQFRSFAVGATLSRTEALQIALISTIFLDHATALATYLGIAVSFAGVLAIAARNSPLSGADVRRQLDPRPILLGLGSGLFFGLSAVFIRFAQLELPDADFLARSSITLLAVTGLQSLVVVPLVMRTGRGGEGLATLVRRPRLAAGLALASFGGSLGWYIALSMVDAVRVQVVGQIGIVFIGLTSWIVFRERPSLLEVAGMALIGAGIILVVVSG